MLKYRELQDFEGSPNRDNDSDGDAFKISEEKTAL